VRYAQNTVLTVSQSFLNCFGSSFFCFHAEFKDKSVDIVSGSIADPDPDRDKVIHG
jgi:hypothetical protein